MTGFRGFGRRDETVGDLPVYLCMDEHFVAFLREGEDLNVKLRACVLWESQLLVLPDHSDKVTLFFPIENRLSIYAGEANARCR
jgi:hypothetical protein